MPQARSELTDQFETDRDAWCFLSKHKFTQHRFLIHIASKRKLTKKEADAIEYLITEWDWDAERNGKSIWWGNKVK